jgi:lipopolysaccharide heptosyltransferase I
VTGELPKSSPPQRVLLIKPSALGDVVTALPVLRALRRAFPQAHLAWLVRNDCSPLIAHDSDLNEVILFDRRYLGRAWRSIGSAVGLWKLNRRLKRGRFDWVIDLQGLFRSAWFARATGAPLRAGFADAREGAPAFYTHSPNVCPRHTVDRNIALARELGLDARPEDMTLQVAPEARAFAEQCLASGGLKRKGFLVCLPPTTWATKRYPVRHWRKVVSALSRDLPVVLLGSPSAGDRELCRAVAEGLDGGVTDLSGRTDVAQMVAVVAASAGVVCCDSAAKFIAPAVGVDAVTLIGPTQVERTGPYPRGRAIVAPVPCQGCLKKRCRHVTCMELIDPGEVAMTARAMLT